MGDRKVEILDAAEDLLRARSFSAFSYHDISLQLGITKASIHYHFASKDDLGVALCDRFTKRFREWASAVDEQAESGWEKLNAYFEFVGCILGGGDKICTSGVLEAEFNVISDRLRGCVQQMVNEQINWLTRVLAEGRALGEFAFSGKPEDQAVMISAALQGALQIARVFGSCRFAAVAEQIRASMQG